MKRYHREPAHAGRGDRGKGRSNAGPRWIAAGLILLVLGCAGPNRDLWPPQPGTPVHQIIVSLDPWHAMIAFSAQASSSPPTPDGSPLTPHGFYEEWGYAEEGWYVEGRRGLTGMLRVLFWFPSGVVEVGEHDRVWADRTPQPPSDRFIFHVSEEGFIRLRRHLRATIASSEPVRIDDGSRFYPASRSYNLLVHQCHQYAAHALREAGLPVSAWLAFSRSSFAAQLHRAERMAEEAKAP